MTHEEGDLFGLSQRDLETLKKTLTAYPEISQVVIFGSRAKGNWTKGSDIDLAVMNQGVSDAVIRKLKGDFIDSSLPHTVDVVNYPSLNHPELKSHIDRVGRLFYNNETWVNPK